MVITHKVAIDFARNNYIDIEVTKSSSYTVLLEMHLLENGKEMDLSGIGAVSFKATKPDGNIVFNDVEHIVSSGHIEYMISKSIMEVTGKTVCVLQLIDTVGKVLNSFEFYVTVMPSLYDEDDFISDSDLSGFRTYMIRAEKAAEESEGVKNQIELAYGSLADTSNTLSGMKKEYVSYLDELKERVNSGEFNGKPGPPGKDGANAVVTEVQGFIAFQIVGENLYCFYSGDEPPNIAMNERGELEIQY